MAAVVQTSIGGNITIKKKSSDSVHFQTYRSLFNLLEIYYQQRTN